MAQSSHKEKQVPSPKNRTLKKITAVSAKQNGLLKIINQWNAEDAISEVDDKAEWGRLQRRLKTSPVSI